MRPVDVGMGTTINTVKVRLSPWEKFNGMKPILIFDSYHAVLKMS